MPKIFEKDGFVIYAYFAEQSGQHHAPHIHVYRGRFGGASLVLRLPDLAVLEAAMTAGEAKKAVAVIQENLVEILEKASGI